MSSGTADFYPHKIDYSCRFNDDDSAYLYRTSTSVEAEYKTWIFSTWIKRCNLGTGQGVFSEFLSNAVHFKVYFYTDDLLYIDNTNNGNTMAFNGYRVYRDPTSWMHIVIKIDTTQATAADRQTLWVNGEEQTLNIATQIAQNAETFVNYGLTQRISRAVFTNGTIVYLDGYQADSTMVAGATAAALTPSSFGELKNGIWVPKSYTGSYGTNGFHLDFADSADLGNDVSGNGNDFTSSGLAANDQVLDTPTNNYPTLNTVDNGPYGNIVFSDGNLKTVSGDNSCARGTISFDVEDSDGIYFEVTQSVLGRDTIGIMSSDDSLDRQTGYTWCPYNGYKYTLSVGVAYGTAASAGNIIGVAVKGGKVWFAKNNSWQGSGDPVAGTNEAHSGLTGMFTPYKGNVGNIAGATALWNFGQLGFTYTPPTGFKALCSSNLTDPTIKDSSKGFDVVTYEGTGAAQSITDLNFQPDVVWIKNRDAADNHRLVDSVRGATYEIYPNVAAAQALDANGLTAFLSNGFSLGTGANGYNDSGESFVAWCFRKGAKYGFDIQSYEGTGIAHAEGHDLGGVPELMYVQNLDAANYSAVYHHHALNKTDPETDYAILALVQAWADLDTMWNDTAPTSSQFTVGTNANVNTNANTYVAYLWRSIDQFSKVFSFIGNANANGPFVYCGFRPAYIIFRFVGTVSWYICDVKRNTFNVMDDWLVADGTNIEFTQVNVLVDVVSNGFKIRGSSASINTSAQITVGIAIAEQPSKYANAR